MNKLSTEQLREIRERALEVLSINPSVSNVAKFIKQAGRFINVDYKALENHIAAQAQLLQQAEEDYQALWKKYEDLHNA